MNRGFTLIELLAVIIILTLLVGIGVVSVNVLLNNSKETLSNTQKRNLEKAAQTYNISEGINIDAKCVNVSKLLSEGYIQGDSVINPKDNEELIGSVKIEYKNNKYVYTYQDDKCSVCQLVSDSDNSNSITEGDKYECEVKPGTKYNFYVISQETDGTTNLIMERNICEDGSLATSSNICEVAWMSKNDYNDDTNYGSYGNYDKGPVTAMNFLYNATDDWTNIPNIKINYTDEGNHYGTIKTTNNITKITKKDGIEVTILTDQEGYTNLKARMPYISEVANSNGSNEYLYEYLDGTSWSGVSGKQPTNNISGIRGYWTLSSSADYSRCASYVRYYGNVVSSYTGSRIGVRAVITLEL